VDVVLEEAGGRAEQDAVQEAKLQRGGLAGWGQVGQGGWERALDMQCWQESGFEWNCFCRFGVKNKHSL
jgi:hypothetical protein